MKRLLLAMLLVPASLALAAEEKAAAQSDDPMASWVPPKVKNEAKDRKEIQAVFQAMDAASKRGDLEAAAALVDFPVLMATDDSKGEGMGEVWDRQKWTQVMKPFYDKPMTDVKVTHKPTIFVMTDSLASVHDVATMNMGNKTVTTRNTTLLIRRDGKWLVKSMAEGGWGDMAKAQGTASSGQGAASEGTGSSAQGSGSEGTGSSAPAPAPGPAPGPSEKTTPERTTK